ncbi:MAG TPA: hypothetical protein VGS21_05775, partial [Acidimicrobiales bacterium]|nr:hypothetical protein [Acidimicrobiales bacterium]
MSDPRLPHAECEAHADDLVALALGTLVGRERAETLTHVESCQRCTADLEEITRTADSLLLVAPPVEPPVGFEVRLFERLGLDPSAASQAEGYPRRGSRRRTADGRAGGTIPRLGPRVRLPVRRVLVGAAAACIAAAGIGV